MIGGNQRMEGDVFSVHDILNDIEAGSAVSTLATIKSEIDRQISSAAISTLWLEKGIVNLSLELVKQAINDCRRSLEHDPDNILAYFVLGVSYLWKGDEETAMKEWQEGLTKSGVILTHLVVSEIVKNCTVREYIKSIRFNVKSLFEFHDNFSPEIICTPFGIDLAVKFIKEKNYPMAITYLNIILSSNASNQDAIKYRGIAYCLSKQYSLAIQDLSTALAMNETDEILRYRANAYAMSKNYFLAIQDLSYVIQYNSTDYESIATRATLQMWRGYFTAALTDFKLIPQQEYNSFTWLSYAEALFAVGKVKLASEYIKYVEKTNNKRAFLEYLICRQKGDLNGAINAMLQITVSTANARILQITAGLFFANGDLKSAIGAYKVALKFVSNPIEYLRSQAICFFCAMNFEKALETCEIITKRLNENQINVDLCTDDNENPIDTPLIKFISRNDPQKINELAEQTVSWIRAIIYHVKDSIESITPTSLIHAPNSLSENIKFETNRMEALKQIAEEADKIGKNVFGLPRDRLPAKRLIRAMGLSALYLGASLRREITSASKCSWKDPFDVVLAILNLADPNNLSTWCDCLVILGHAFNAPKYEVHRGEWLNPRLKDRFQDIMKKFKTKYGFKLSKEGDNIVGFDQPYYVVEGTIPEHDNIPKPSIILEPKVFGFDIYLTPKSDTQSAWQTAVVFDECWKKLINGDNPMNALSKMILLIWLTNQFTFYQNEIGHILLHAYCIAAQGKYCDPFGNDNKEPFVDMLVEPAFPQFFERVKFVYNSFARGDKSVQMSTISFFDSEISVGDLLTMLSL
ncbi:TPR Domain containing protein [Trichomonas vaginalis G3]|uniref:TPR Domain containing protein n=1 Tax=Trichomonas vaginalis (strain ATCC PRA-98 / G3) TaxID=412133 RepID=A2F3X7_TRIV3|nr:suppressor of RPS4-RLD 1 family [Trichomonas vaginalis G3]EAY00393.1 TPR Domain containing protein [Trichomonas vaginalis G3]KAI5528362.1 suppressor of RPS4-RLD 1 family [Trichomonas vaginalis G3]|eukprot:XP_001313322.1 TPR Domain containing protein [Trichomonas vaginalis G3]